MSRLDWDRAARDAAIARGGAEPAWNYLGDDFDDRQEQRIERLVRPQVEILEYFRGLTRSQRQRVSSNTRKGLRELQSDAEMRASRWESHHGKLTLNPLVARQRDLLTEFEREVAAAFDSSN
jgi:hypothetical protein